MTDQDKPTRQDMATRASVFLRLGAPDKRPREVAWQAFHDRYAPLIATYARRKGATPQQAEEVVQDVLLGFFSASARFVYDPAAGRFRGYLRTCVWRTLKRIRDSERAFDLAASPVEDFELADAKAADPSDLSLWDELWERQRLHRILAEVREHYRRRGKIETFIAFERNVLFNEPAAKVAEDLKISSASVHVAKMRVTRRLATMKARLIQEEG